MKKIILIFVGILLLSSCKSKRATTRTHTNTRRNPVNTHQTTQIRHKNSKQTNESVIPKSNTIKEVAINENTIYNKQLIDDLYNNKPYLDQKKVRYIKQYSELAINEMLQYKIPASITLAQALLESRNGQSTLTKKSKNHFGIKCHTWTGKRVYHDDDAKDECFRKYDYDANSFRDHSLFLAGKKRYAKLFTYPPNDYRSWAKGLRKAGYATDKRYPQKLIDLIEKYELHSFDKMVLGNNYQPIPIPTKEEETIERQIIRYHIVEAGETLYTISGKYYIDVEDIKYFNNLNSNTLAIGQKLKLFGIKEIKTPLKQHIVKKGDTLYNISKKYNITIEKLKTLNNLKNNALAIDQILIIE